MLNVFFFLQARAIRVFGLLRCSRNKVRPINAEAKDSESKGGVGKEEETATLAPSTPPSAPTAELTRSTDRRCLPFRSAIVCYETIDEPFAIHDAKHMLRARPSTAKALLYVAASRATRSFLVKVVE